MIDCALALQYIRLHAADYNIDPGMIGVTGGSAGADISQWLAFHDDPDDSGSPYPIEGDRTLQYPVLLRSVFHQETNEDRPDQ
jgi:acetyl esterase/lipase